MVPIGISITGQLCGRCSVSKWSAFLPLKFRRKSLCRKPTRPREPVSPAQRRRGLVQRVSPRVDTIRASRPFQREDAECRRRKSGPRPAREGRRGDPGFSAGGVGTPFHFKPLDLKRSANVCVCFEVWHHKKEARVSCRNGDQFRSNSRSQTCFRPVLNRRPTA